MKTFFKVISSKKALMVVLTLASICSVLEVITSIRTGMRIAFTPMTLMFVNIALWADALEKEEAKEKEAKK